MFKIEGELLQKVLNYLATKPYSEVSQLISELVQLKNIEAEEKGENT